MNLVCPSVCMFVSKPPKVRASWHFVLRRHLGQLKTSRSPIFLFSRMLGAFFVFFLSHQTSKLPESFYLSKHLTNLKHNGDRFSKFAFLYLLRHFLNCFSVVSFHENLSHFNTEDYEILTRNIHTQNKFCWKIQILGSCHYKNKYFCSNFFCTFSENKTCFLLFSNVFIPAKKCLLLSDKDKQNVIEILTLFFCFLDFQMAFD